jgi:hypothetical protein
MRTSCATLFALLVVVLSAPMATAESLHSEHSFTVRPDATLIIDVSFHEVVVTARPGQTVDVVVDLEVRGSGPKAAKRLAELEPVFRDDGDTLLVRSVRKGGINWGSSRATGRVVVEMPPDMDLEVDSASGSCTLTGDFGEAALSIDATSGPVRIAGAARELNVDTASGSVAAELSRPAQRLVADTASGSITVTGGAHRVEADSSSGGIRLSGLLGDASLDSSSGSITAHWSSLPTGTAIAADTSSGRVRLTLPPGTPLSGTIETGSGGIQSDFSGTWQDRGHRLELRGGREAVRIDVDTSSGGVQLIAG